MRQIAIALSFSLCLLGRVAYAHTGVPAEPSGLHPIYHGDALVGGYTSKGFVEYGNGSEVPTWRRLPATSGMYVAAYGTPDGTKYALTTAGLWQFSDGGCTYEESPTQFGPMTLVQSAFHPSRNHLSWIGATASNGKPILYHSTDGATWERILTLPAGLGWRGMLWNTDQENALAIFRAREALTVVSLKPDGNLETREDLAPTLPLEAVLLLASPDYTKLYFRSVGESETGEELWLCDRGLGDCSMILDSEERLFHALWYQDSNTLAWMDERGERTLLTPQGDALSSLESLGYFGFLPNLGSSGWFLKKLPASHAFSTLDEDGTESPWMAFDEIAINPCPPKPGENPDTSNPFEEGVDEGSDTTDSTDATELEPSPTTGASSDERGGGCQSADANLGLALLLLSLVLAKSQRFCTGQKSS